MGKVMDVSGFDIVVYSRNEHLPSHVHIEKDGRNLGEISLYPTVEVIDPKITRIPEGFVPHWLRRLVVQRKKTLWFLFWKNKNPISIFFGNTYIFIVS